MKNTINLLSVVYLSAYDADIEIEICSSMEEWTSNFNNLTVKLQDYKHNEELEEGCMTFTLSRPLTRTEREEFRSEWETERIQLQFHKQRKLF